MVSRLMRNLSLYFFTADVYIFNALISAVPDVRDKFNERWDLIAVSKTLCGTIQDFFYPPKKGENEAASPSVFRINCVFVGVADADEPTENSSQPAHLQQRSQIFETMRLFGQNLLPPDSE